MKKHLRNCVTSALLLLPAAVSLVALPSSALAQPATPEVRSFEAEADAGLEPGSRLRFRLTGTPRVKASIRIRGLREGIPLREVSPGVYVGRYTLKRTDRVAGDAEVRAVLRHGNRIGAAEYVLSEAMAAPVAVAPPPPPPRPVEPAVRIERFGMVPVERIEPGAELSFSVEGMPGARVTVDLPGVERDVSLRETRPGHYEGSYTIRRADNINPNRPIVATLRVGERVATANLDMAVGRPGAGNRPPGGDNRPPGGDNQPPRLSNVTPREGQTIPGGPPTNITANFEDGDGSGVDPASVRIAVSGRDVTPDAHVSPRLFSYRAPLPAGRHTVNVTARDRAGNVMRGGWSFEVAAAVPANLPIQILNHGNNGHVGSGQTVVQGRTGPNALVEVTVQATAPVGGVVNISQNLFSQTVQADANGNFAFSFTPQIPIPNTRYDIAMVSNRGGVTHESRMSLFQR